MSRQPVPVTGASGVIGRRLLPALVAGDHEVFGLARSERAADRVSELGGEPVLGDVLDRGAVDSAVAQVLPTTIIHHATALSKPVSSPRRMGPIFETTNRIRSEGTRYLVDAAERHGVQRLIAQSVTFAYRHEGPPDLDEGALLDLDAGGAWGEMVRAVAALEEAVMGARNVKGVVLRYGALYGPESASTPDGPIGQLVLGRRMPIIGSGEGRTSFVHVGDAVGAALDALEGGWGIYNIVDDRPAPAAQWLPALAETLGAPPPRRLPAALVRVLAGEPTVRLTTTQRGALNAKAKAELGFRPEYPDWREGSAELVGESASVVAVPSG